MYEKIKNEILRYAIKRIPKGEKKKEVDRYAVALIMGQIRQHNLPGPDAIWHKVINALLSALVPIITQLIYDGIKNQVHDLEK